MKRFAITFLLVAFLLAGCGQSKTPSVMEYRTVESDFAVQGMAPAMGGGYAAESPQFAEGYKSFDAGDISSNTSDRLVIQNADLNIVVKDPEAKMEAIAAMAARMGGFVVNSNLYQTRTAGGQTVPEASIAIRVPAERLDEALNEIKQGVGDVLYQNRTGQDVTQSYTDLKSRLKNLELAEQQLQEILDKTTDPDAVVNLFNQLVYYREQIELVKGQIQYFEQAAALSAISVRIVAEESIAPLEIGNWKPQGTARDAIQMLINFMQGFANFIIYLVLLVIPAGLMILGPLWLVWKALRQMMRRNNTKTDGKETAPDKSE